MSINGPICRVRTALDSDRLVRIRFSSGSESRIAFARPGQTLLLKRRTGRGGLETSRAIVGTLEGDTTIVMRPAFPGMRESMPSQLAEVRLAMPDQLDHRWPIVAEFTANIPTGAVLIPKRALQVKDGNQRVAVKGPDGSFRWRSVVVKAINGDDIIVSKMLAEGESIALDPLVAMGEPPANEDDKPVTPSEPSPR